MSRPEWIKLCKKLTEGDTVVFDSVSRMSRDAAEGISVYEQLFEQGIVLKFLKEPGIDTDVYRTALNNRLSAALSADSKPVDDFLQSLTEALNELIKGLAREQVRLAFVQSEKEVTDLRQRTKEGLAQAAKKGHIPGRKPGIGYESAISRKSKDQILKHSKTFGGNLSDAEVIKLCGCSRNSYYKYKRELTNDAGLTGEVDGYIWKQKRIAFTSTKEGKPTDDL